MPAGYSIVNLLELDDAVTSVAGIEGRFAREQIESYVVVAGSGRILLGDEVRELRPWDVVRASPEVVPSWPEQIGEGAE